MMLTALSDLASRRLRAARQKVMSDIEKWQLLVDNVNDFQAILKTKFDIPPSLVDDYHRTSEEVKRSDYLGVLGLGKKVITIRDDLTHLAITRIEQQVALGNDAVRKAEQALKDAKRKCELLVEEARTRGNVDIRKAESALVTLESTQKRNEELSSVVPKSRHFGAGCLVHFIILSFVIRSFPAPKVHSFLDALFGLFVLVLALSGWSILGYLFAWLGTQLKRSEAASDAAAKRDAIQDARLNASRLFELAKVQAEKEATRDMPRLQEELSHAKDRLENANRVLKYGAIRMNAINEGSIRGH